MGMEDCCSTDPQNLVKGAAEAHTSLETKRVSESCPQCRQKGKSVPGQTVKSILSDSLRLVEPSIYYFCRTESCPVVYFSADGKSSFTTNQIRERVYQKEPGDSETKVCYCFDHRVGEIHRASPGERQLIVEDINVGIAAGQCTCDLRNPQGTCCLGNVLKLTASQQI